MTMISSSSFSSFLLLVSALALSRCVVSSFQIHATPQYAASHLFRTTSSSSSSSSSSKLHSVAADSHTSAGLVSLDRTAPRQVEYFQEYAVNYGGVQPENGFCLQSTVIDEQEEWYATTAEGAPEGSRVLWVPQGMILSSRTIANEFTGYVEQALFAVQENYPHLVPQFYLFLKVLMEYELGDESPYGPWLAALPRKWNTAVAMDDFCLSCLPPYLLGVCKEERYQYAIFKQAVQDFEYVSSSAKENDELLKFAYNVVMTRSFASPQSTDDYKIVPVADMVNHGHPGNTVLMYDDEDNCSVVLQKDVAPGEPLTMSYGNPNNPSRLLSKYGFLHEAPATFCKMVISKPSEELVQVGYDPERMLYDTATGEIAPEVWDVLLYSRLERKPQLQHIKEAFYQAHMKGDTETKGAIHQQFQQDTCSALRRHVDHILIEVHELTVKMNAYDSSKHPRLPLLRKHHAMVTSTFQKVREYLTSISTN
eukprot:CAMPEP_0195298656 /NCGR_PEP_ID=MMETSP0707-20130614/23973_1 /TAXON_ID=33640 /ORGANISM="Asterionellopsis glacialis, Strain CCMP134" /LENGTH=479 /DNA_ID=CAMNT_0040360845 /DNA_START=94 /DNA_END=1533 /DNA_ORIENTATION=-